MENKIQKEVAFKIELGAKQLEFIEKEFTQIVDETIKLNMEELGDKYTKEVEVELIKELNRRKDIMLEDELSLKEIETYMLKATEVRNKTTLTYDKILDRRILVSKNNPSKLTIKEGNSMSDIEIGGNIYKVLLKFAKAGQLFTEGDKHDEKELNVTHIRKLGYEVVSSKLSKGKASSILGAKIYKHEQGDIVFIISATRIDPEVPSIIAIEKFSILEAKAIIDNFNAFEKVVNEKEMN